MIRRIILAVMATAPLTALAHEGHGVISAQNFAHYIGEPMHVIPAVLVIGFAIYCARRALGRNKQR